MCLAGVCLVAVVGSASAQQAGDFRVAGRVLDASTNEPLAGATIQAAGTYRGTITNAAGEFQLNVPSFPARLEIRFIGYVSRQIDVEAPDEDLHIPLSHAALELPELVVTDEDPAVGIMRRVIEEKKRWRAGLESYTVDAYNRMRVSNDTAVVSIWESRTKAVWHRELGLREVPVWREQTANRVVDEDDLMAAAYILNFYDDDLEFEGHRLMGPTHPDALGYYRFTLEGTRALDDRLVYDIHIEPRHRTGSGYVGTVSVLDEEYAMIEIDLRPSEAFIFPPPFEHVDIAYRQQFSSFGQDVWLPVNLEAEYVLKVGVGFILDIPAIRLRQFSRLSDFDLNPDIPATVFSGPDDVVRDTAFVAAMKAAPADDLRVPLTAEEQLAYESIDSTMTMARAFRPRGLLGRLVDLDDDGGSGGHTVHGSSGRTAGEAPVEPSFIDRLRLSFEPDARFNRVEALHAGGRATLRDVSSARVTGSAAYLTGPGDIDWSVGLRYGRRNTVLASFADGVQPVFDSPVHEPILNSAWVLLGGTDYFDYFHVRGWRAGVARGDFPRDWMTTRVTFTQEEHESVARSIRSTLPGITTDPIPNPAVSEGIYRSIELALLWRGPERSPLGVDEHERADVRIERGLEGGAVDDSGFWRLEIDLMDRLPTFFRRRPVSNSLEYRIHAGWSSGELPPQRSGYVDATSSVSRFGAMKTLLDRPYRADRWMQIAWEHSFRTIPFEWIGWAWAVDRFWNVIVTGGHVWTGQEVWSDLDPAGDGDEAETFAFRSAPSGGHHELGVSLSGILTVVRVDATWRLDHPGFYVGVGVARIF